MMKLLNQRYPTPVRAVIACLAFTMAMFATGRPALARELAGRCWTHHDYKVAARRGAWYFRRGWLNFEVSPDDFFDPTESLIDSQLDVLESFVAGRQSKLAAMTYAADMAIIAARRLNNNSLPAHRANNIARFEKACDHLLAQDTLPKDISDPTPDARTGDFPINDAKVTLRDFAALFPPEALRWFIISGTFLGLIRENGFLPHDYDIDLGVFENEIDIQTTLEKIAASDHFVLKKYDFYQSALLAPSIATRNPDIPYIIKLVHKTGIHIDLFIHYHDTSADITIDWHGSSLHRWTNTAFDLVPYAFYDQTVLGPADADRYLTENYGDWRTPVKEFNCTTDTPNLALVPHPIAIVIFLHRYVRALINDPEQAAKLESEMIHNGFLINDASATYRFSGAVFNT